MFNATTLFYAFLYLSFVGMSFFFSGTESGYLSINRYRFNEDLEQKKSKAFKIRRYVVNLDYVLTVTLFGNNLANIATTNLGMMLVKELGHGEKSPLVAIAVNTFTIVLLFSIGEVIPKLLFRTYANVILYKTYYLFRFFDLLFYPITLCLGVFTRLISKMFYNAQNSVVLSKRDFHHLLQDFYEGGMIDRKETYFVSVLSSISRTKVIEVMRPLADLRLIEKNNNLDDVRKGMGGEDMGFIFVYDKRIDNIIGYVSIFDLLRAGKRAKTPKPFIKEVQYIPHFMTIDNAYEIFSNTDSKTLVVVDEYGGCSGVIHQKDIMERFFGLSYKRDSHKKDRIIKRIDDYVYEFDSSLDIDDFELMFNLKIEKAGFETIAGFLYQLFGYIPKKGYVIEWEGISFEVLEATRKSVDKVKVTFSKEKYNFEKEEVSFLKQIEEKTKDKHSEES